MADNEVDVINKNHSFLDEVEVSNIPPNAPLDMTDLAKIFVELTPKSQPPATYSERDVYLDDGTNTSKGAMGFRYYNGTDWIDIGGGAGDYTDDDVNDLLTAGNNITLTYDDAANTLTIDSEGKTEEEIEDIVNGLLTTGNGVTTLTYDDNANTLTVEVLESSISLANLGSHSHSDLTNISEGDHRTDEAIQDLVDTLLTGGSNVTLTYDDASNELTISATDTDTQTDVSDDTTTVVSNVDDINFGSLISVTDDGDGSVTVEGTDTTRSDEEIQDVVDTLLTAGNAISLTYDDAGNTLTVAVDESAIQVDDEDVSISEIGTATYNDVEGWLNTTQSAGTISGFSISDGGSGTIDISSGKGFIKETDDSTDGAILSFDYSGTTGLSLTDLSVNYIYIDYNSGNPQAVATTNEGDINHNTQIEIGLVYRNGTNLSIRTGGIQISNHPYRTHDRLLSVDESARASGLILGETGTRNVTVSSGVVYSGLKKISHDAIDTSSTDTFDVFNSSDSDAPDATGQTQYDNTQYWDGSSLSALGNNRYGTRFFYLSDGGELFMQYGTSNASSVGGANDESVPTPPSFLTEFAIYLGRIVIQEGGSTAENITSSFDLAEAGQVVTSHDNLANISANDHIDNLTDIPTKNHNDLDNISAGDHRTEEQIEDIVNGLLVGGTNVTLSYDDAANTLTIDASGSTDTRTDVSANGSLVVSDVTDINFGSLLSATDDGDGSVTIEGTDTTRTDEEIQDVVDSLLTAGSDITLNYDDASNSLSIAVGSSVLRNVSEDSSPSLGGDLDLSRHNLNNGREANIEELKFDKSRRQHNGTTMPTTYNAPILSLHSGANNPVLTGSDMTDLTSDRGIADPCIVYDQGTYHMFAEAITTETYPSIIHATSPDALNWTYDQAVISPTHHIAYPNVFKHDGTWYMTPDHSYNDTDDGFNIYKATTWPTDWTHVEQAINVTNGLGDPTPILWDGTWYLFITDRDATEKLLWYSDSLVGGSWTEHSASPIQTDTNTYRNAGRPLVYEDYIDFFSQDDNAGSILCHRITELTKTSFSWTEVATSPIMTPSGRWDWMDIDVHHISPMLSTFGQQGLALIDGQNSSSEFSVGVVTLGQSSRLPKQLQNLDMYNKSVTHIEGATFQNVHSNGTISSNYTIDWTDSNKHDITLGADITISFTDPNGAANLLLKINQDGTGGRSVTWPSNVYWAGGSAPTLSTSAGATDIVSLVHDGTDYWATLSKGFA